MQKFAALLTLAAFIGISATAIAEKTSPWTSAKDGFPEAQKTQKLILIDVYANW